ncbi:hypothetical protein FVD38_19105 [Massilia arenae]|uniref:Flagellar hook-length control protein-like C-terminal domain-containing protein n=2 Tax=Massilia arenae TaxID=2603288 RepID=A0A5C7FPZ1_9BURK|nr:hypothetical protein FVD38_19105 [Massilia arenae]
MNFSMNSAMNAIIAVGNASAKVTANGAPADSAQVPEGVVLPGAGPALLRPALPVLPFQHWIGADGALPQLDAAAPVDGAAPESSPEPLEDEQADETLAAEQAVAIDAVLAAMTPQASPAALPAMMLAMSGAKPGAANDGAAPAALAAVTDAAAAPEGQPVAATSAAPDVPVLPLPVAAAVPRVDAAAQPLPVTPASAPAAAATPGANTAADAAANTATSAAVDGAPLDSSDSAPTIGAAGVAPGQPAAARGAASAVLAGPPTAWRQTLHEALGERLQLQVGRGVEQATIRLEPPMLGRIDISVRHSGGNLEVHIAATNTEVLRQLNTVSDSLRNDLAGRQYSNVSVNVSEAPRAQASAQAGNQPSGQPGADAQGRGRQQEQEEQRQRTPGLALNDAGDAGSLFSMNDRD